MVPLLRHFVCILGHFVTKKRVFSTKFFFAPNCISDRPRWFGGLINPKLTTQNPQRTPCRAILWAIWAILGPKNAFFSEIVCQTDLHFWWSPMVWRSQQPEMDPLLGPMKPHHFHTNIVALFNAGHNATPCTWRAQPYWNPSLYYLWMIILPPPGKAKMAKIRGPRFSTSMAFWA